MEYVLHFICVNLSVDGFIIIGIFKHSEVVFYFFFNLKKVFFTIILSNGNWLSNYVMVNKFNNSIWIMYACRLQKSREWQKETWDGCFPTKYYFVSALEVAHNSEQRVYKIPNKVNEIITSALKMLFVYLGGIAPSY